MKDVVLGHKFGFVVTEWSVAWEMVHMDGCKCWGYQRTIMVDTGNDVGVIAGQLFSNAVVAKRGGYGFVAQRWLVGSVMLQLVRLIGNGTTGKQLTIWLLQEEQGGAKVSQHKNGQRDWSVVGC